MKQLSRIIFPLICLCGISSLSSGSAYGADRRPAKKFSSKPTPVAVKTAAPVKAAAPTEVDLGWKSIAEWKTDEALQHFKAASQQAGGKTNYQIAWGFAAAYGQLSNFSESIRWFEKASEQYSNNSRLLSDFGFTYMSWGVYQARTAKTKTDLTDAKRNWDEAERKFLAASQISPKESLSYSRLAMLSYYRGDLAQAWKYAKLSKKLGGEELDPRFLTDLAKRMPEPQ